MGNNGKLRPQHLTRAIQSLYVVNKILFETGRRSKTPSVGLISVEYVTDVRVDTSLFADD